MKKKRFLRLRGSYTVEASFILPIVLTVIVLVIYLSFFLHDRALLQSAAYTACLRGSQLVSGEDVYGTVEKSSRDLIKGRLLATENLSTDIEIGHDSVSVAYSGVFRIPAGALLTRLLAGGKNRLDIGASSKADCINPVEFVRKCRIVERLPRSEIGGRAEAGADE